MNTVEPNNFLSHQQDVAQNWHAVEGGEYDKMLADEQAGAEVRHRAVVCAANRYGKVIVCGARHYDNTMRGVVAVLQRDAEEYGDDLPKA